MSINDVLTLSEVEDVWGIKRVTVKKAILSGRLADGTYRQSGSTWLVSINEIKKLWAYKIKD